MKKIYFMCDSPYQKVPSAVALENAPFPYDTIEGFENTNEIPYNFILKNMEFKKGRFIYNDDFSKYERIWGDCQLNSNAWVMVSPKLKEVIDEHLKGGECFRWMVCKILHGDEKRVYYTPFFTQQLDVLDMEKCFYDNREHTIENLIKPVYSAKKIEDIAIFPRPMSSSLWKMPTGFIVTDDIKKAIKKAGFKGIDFEQVALVE